MGKRLTRSRDSRMIAGVCGGLANYFRLDPTLVRLGMVALVLFSVGSLVLFYLIAALIIPKEDYEEW
ncbi:PspC domain-containing protein [Shouchella lonarensis]|uniref:Phage shock protein C (PspC) family protein n=1 Tax=Shouchella lonarensis TaxID=1464122 RepID=A0A1G6H204_9BACI|nr:PspC domain-containing protein [Shouchella lonarensis]SDB88231.1 phage shock protein C (PspC) family protein [Shouchella lonarensis]